jgi:hypothetical protein
LGVEGGNHVLHIGIGDGSGLVDDGYVQHGALLAVRQMFALSSGARLPSQRSIVSADRHG